MAKIIVYILEKKDKKEVDNQRQIIASLDGLKNQLKFDYKNDLKNEEDAKEWFLGG